jgi:ABC-type phosphate/phosphonate transport system substrate-binding protein
MRRIRDCGMSLVHSARMYLFRCAWNCGTLPPLPMTVRRSILGSALAILVLALGPHVSAQSGQRLAFIGVSLDATTRQADQRLTDYLSEKVGIRFAHEELEYAQVIRRLVDWRSADGPFVARMTPYAYVVAELLGASVEPLATYVSASTGRTTYRSYFVVNRSAFAKPPELPDLLRFLASRKGKARFVYQSEFSTSSFFLPALFFRAQRVFQMPESTERLTAIVTEKLVDVSSSALVERVASGQADVAAVWDGVKAKFESDPASRASGQRVYFIELPTAIPNDLLVSAAHLDGDTKNHLRTAIGAMPATAIDIGDFRSWRTLNESADTRLALGALRQAARESAARVPVEIQLATGAPAPAAALVEAARQAVRLSETEFVLFDADFHAQPDVRWTIEPIHDGAVVLHSAIPGYDVDEQAFQLSFRDELDLTARIVSVIQSRMHRIRYVWSYSGSSPIVLRDSAFVLPVGAPVRVQRITWIDPERNQFRAGEVFGARVERASFHRYELAADDFGRPAAGARPDPMSNAAYRVVLMRPDQQPWLFRALTVALVACFVLAGGAAGWAMMRRPLARPASAPAQSR